MKKTITRHGLSFRNASAGVFWAFKTQPNMVVHLLAAVLAVAAGFYFNISKEEWLVLVLTIALVATAEVLNTAVEVVSDLMKLKKLTEKEDRLVMLAKDVSAGAVLLAALGAVAVGVLIFGPQILLLR